MGVKTDVKMCNLNLNDLRVASKSALNFVPVSKTLSDAYDEVFHQFRRRATELGWDIQYGCHYCNSQAALQLPTCWACKATFNDEAADPPLSDAELKLKAKEIGVEDFDLMSRAELERAVESRTNEMRRLMDKELIELEAKRLNEKLREIMPPLWVCKPAKLGVSYFDPNGRRRIFVPHRGIGVQFSVKDGELDGLPGLRFYDDEHRRRHHLGRSNYHYVSKWSKDVFGHCERVFKSYRVG